MSTINGNVVASNNQTTSSTTEKEEGLDTSTQREAIGNIIDELGTPTEANGDVEVLSDDGDLAVLGDLELPENEAGAEAQSGVAEEAPIPAEEAPVEEAIIIEDETPVEEAETTGETGDGVVDETTDETGDGTVDETTDETGDETVGETTEPGAGGPIMTIDPIDGATVIDGDYTGDIHLKDGEKLRINGDFTGNIFMANEAELEINGNFDGDLYMNSNNKVTINGDAEAFIVANNENDIDINGNFTAAENDFKGGLSLVHEDEEAGVEVRTELQEGVTYAAGTYINRTNDFDVTEDSAAYIKANEGNEIDSDTLTGELDLNQNNTANLRTMDGVVNMNDNNTVNIAENFNENTETGFGGGEGFMKSLDSYVIGASDGRSLAYTGEETLTLDEHGDKIKGELAELGFNDEAIDLIEKAMKGESDNQAIGAFINHARENGGKTPAEWAAIYDEELQAELDAADEQLAQREAEMAADLEEAEANRDADAAETTDETATTEATDEATGEADAAAGDVMVGQEVDPELAPIVDEAMTDEAGETTEATGGAAAGGETVDATAGGDDVTAADVASEESDLADAENNQQNAEIEADDAETDAANAMAAGDAPAAVQAQGEAAAANAAVDEAGDTVEKEQGDVDEATAALAATTAS